ncbi:MAG: hypothetical protein RSC13_05755 [Clostridium sp.]
MGKSRKKQPGESLSDKELRRYVIFLMIFCVILVLIAVIIFSDKKKTHEVETINTISISSVSESQTHIPIIEPDTKEYIQDFGSSILKQDAVPEINQLMEQYFLSTSDCDMETFMHLFTSEDTAQTEKFKARFEKEREYIESYQNISCYTAPGMEDDTYVVYVYYDTKFVGVDTLGPALVQVYAVKCTDGQYRIYDQEISTELEEFLMQVSKNEDVRLLVSQVDRKMTEAMEADAELKERISYLAEGPEYMQEGTPVQTQAQSAESAESAESVESAE